MIVLKHCRVSWTPDGCATTFNDGASVDACHHPDLHHYRVISHRLGYQDDTLRYAREHEVIHSLVAEWFWDVPSPVLWALAHGTMLNGHASVAEEVLAQTVQRWLRANERPLTSGVNWDALKHYAIENLG